MPWVVGCGGACFWCRYFVSFDFSHVYVFSFFPASRIFLLSWFSCLSLTRLCFV